MLWKINFEVWTMWCLG